jgi:hypothetical protein
VYELVALAIGAGFGMAWRHLGPRAGTPLVVVGALVTGLAVSSLSGELELSWAFLLFDVGQVLVAAACVAALARVIAGPAPRRVAR